MDTRRFRVGPGDRVRLAELDPASTAGFDGGRKAGEERLDQLREQLAELQALLYADGRHKLLVVLQAPDAGGKDGTIRSVFAGVNPQGVRVTSFKMPTEDDLAHDYLWRVHRHTPANGEIAVFNRSHYEDVLVVRVHELVPEHRWRRRYRHLVEFERLLADEGTTIVKLFLHISPEEQRQRLQERIDDPAKRWKFRRGDLDERARWDDYRAAYEDALGETSTEVAPWYVVPADRNWFRDLVVAEVLVETLGRLDLRYPPAEPGVEGLVVS